MAQDRVAARHPDRNDRRACSDLRPDAAPQQPGLERARKRAEPEPPLARFILANFVTVQRAGESVAAPEDQGFGRRHGDPEVIRDLLIGQSLPVAEQHGPALRLRDRRECFVEAEQLVGGFSAGRELGQPVGIVRELDFAAALAGIPTRPADVPRDREQPWRFERRNNPSADGSERVEEGRLHSIVRFIAITQLVETEAEDAAMMPLEQAFAQMRLGCVQRLFDPSSPTD